MWWWYKSGSGNGGLLPDASKPLTETVLTFDKQFIVNEVILHPPENNFTATVQATFLCNEVKKYIFILLLHLPAVNEFRNRIMI